MDSQVVKESLSKMVFCLMHRLSSSMQDMNLASIMSAFSFSVDPLEELLPRILVPSSQMIKMHSYGVSFWKKHSQASLKSLIICSGSSA